MRLIWPGCSTSAERVVDMEEHSVIREAGRLAAENPDFVYGPGVPLNRSVRSENAASGICGMSFPEVSMTDPLARALGAHSFVPYSGDVFAVAGGKFFVLTGYSIDRRCLCQSERLRTCWGPMDDFIRKATITLRFRVRMKVQHWKRKVLG